MRGLNKKNIDALNHLIGRDVVDGILLMINNGYTEDELMNMPIGDILDYYDNYYKPNTKKTNI